MNFSLRNTFAVSCKFWAVVSSFSNISHGTIKKVLEENTGRKFSDIPCSTIFTNMSPRARGIKEGINKWNFIKIKSFCMAKENNSKMNREPTIWENIFANHISHRI